MLDVMGDTKNDKMWSLPSSCLYYSQSERDGLRHRQKKINYDIKQSKPSTTGDQRKQGLLRGRIIKDTRENTAQFHLFQKQMSLNRTMGGQRNENEN